MGFRIIPSAEETHQVLDVNLCDMFLIANGLLTEYFVEDGVYAEAGEVLLYQTKTKPKHSLEGLYEEMKKDLHDEGIDDISSYEDLLDFDELIFCKAKYKLGATDEDGNRIMTFTETIPLDQYMTINRNGELEDVEM